MPTMLTGLAFAASNSDPHPLSVSGHHVLDFTVATLAAGVAFTLGIAIYFLRRNKRK